MEYVEAFAKYGAKLTNPQWSVSGFGKDGCLVLSLWQDGFKRGTEKDTLVYEDILSAWKGNQLGRAELKEHLQAALAARVPIRAVMGHPAMREDLGGIILAYDGDQLRIAFKRTA